MESENVVRTIKNTRPITKRYNTSGEEFELDNLIFLIFAIRNTYEHYADTRWKRGGNCNRERYPESIQLFLVFLSLFSFYVFPSHGNLMQAERSRAYCIPTFSRVLHLAPSLQKERCQENNRNSSEKVMYLGYISSARCSSPREKTKSFQRNKRRRFILPSRT